MRGNHAILALFVWPLCAGAAAPGREVRAIWVTRRDFRSEDDVRRIIAGCAALGLNRVVLQVRGQADAYYRSSLEPWGEHLGGPAERDGDPGFDPLEVGIETARRLGIEIYAWVNLLPGWKGLSPPRSRRHIVHAHPEWFLVDQAGRRRILERDRYALVNPCLPAARAHLKAVLGEIAALYRVDGIQLDYARFLDRDPAKGEEVPFDPATLASFKACSGTTPSRSLAAWDRFRQQAMDSLVAEISRAVRERRPALRLSLAAIRDVAHARRHLFQDAEGWLRARWIDEVSPMAYEREHERFARLARAWTAACGPQAVVLGIGVHQLQEPGDVLHQIRTARGEAPAGFCLFAYTDFFPSRSSESRDDPKGQSRKEQLRAALKSALSPD